MDIIIVGMRILIATSESVNIEMEERKKKKALSKQISRWAPHSLTIFMSVDIWITEIKSVLFWCGLKGTQIVFCHLWTATRT